MLLVLTLGACGGPDQAGQSVGTALYDASVSTGHALAVATDRTGRAFESAGSGLRNAVSPATPVAVTAPDLPPPYVPDSFSTAQPVTAAPLPPPVRADPAMGY
jgi:hypothetical protein